MSQIEATEADERADMRRMCIIILVVLPRHVWLDFALAF